MKNLRYPSTSLIKDIEKQTTKNGGLLYFKKNMIHDGFISYIDIISSSRKNRDLLMSLLFGDYRSKLNLLLRVLSIAVVSAHSGHLFFAISFRKSWLYWTL